MILINLESVRNAREKSPKRRCFLEFSGIQSKKLNGSTSFSVPFCETIKPIFEEQTGLSLFYSNEFDNYFRVLPNQEEIDIATIWENTQGHRVFLRDCLTLSIAMSYNFENIEEHIYTEIGQLEFDAKYNQDANSIDKLINLSQDTIISLPFYNEADLVCAVPPPPDKTFDLPSYVVEKISNLINKQNITNLFSYAGTKSSIKSLKVEDKWGAWEKARITIKESNLKGKTVILIDDKYQSGISMEYIAMKLQEAGVSNVYGLCFVKTMKDSDNT